MAPMLSPTEPSSRHAAQGGELTRIALGRAAPLAGVAAWEPAPPIALGQAVIIAGVGCRRVVAVDDCASR
jgi:hypothetical protein